MQLNFACTQCGRCCQGHRVPLSVHEAMAWLRRGGDVHLLCDAVVWPAEPPAGDALAAYRRERSFAAASAAMAVRVGVILAASFPGRCPNLMDDQRCAIYAERPLVCRIYPASINPFEPLGTESKACPPEAWDARGPAFVRAGRLVDEATHALIDQARHLAMQEIPAKQRLCDALGIRVAAMANEGFAVHRPPRAALLAALEASCAAMATQADPVVPVPALPGDWCLLSARAATLEILAEIDAYALDACQAGQLGVEYLDLQPPDGAAG
ncbi:YkgJ family cysteine cluster protein [Acidovorax sp.]|uniref:YkgJ family cysteine cluster protein n=1 Tax=Acidovorax sp. TaxID=1872122 RepID=UPI002ACE6030|nr:YkgJ family cysteine cluster protein [Acidovorax sp.]MDZ7863039.1 YkgJ family cysteine cluster protein [Acidovorax sp.]